MDLSNNKYGFWILFSKTFEILRNNAKYFLLISLIIYLPLNIILEYFWQYLLSEDFTLKELSNYTRLAGFLENIIWVVAEIFIIFLVKSYIDKDLKTFKEYFNESLSLWGKWVLANIHYSIFVWFLLILLIIPWILFAVYWIFFLQILVLKWKDFDYLKHSKELVKWNWWNVFFNIFILYLILFIIAFILGSIQGYYYIYLDNIYVDILVGTFIDYANIFIYIFITLKFLNLDWIKNKKKEEEQDKEKNEIKVEEDVEL